MRRELKIKRDEPLYKWVERLVSDYDERVWSTIEFQQVLTEVSKESYIHGTEAAHKVYGGVIARRGGEA